jgi:hypothetical protein
MDPLTNPFSPGAGSPPPELVGRNELLEDARILLGRTKRGMSEKSMLLTGLRGVGKTVLLNEIRKIAKDAGYLTLLIEAHEDKALGPLIAAQVRPLLFELDRMAGAGNLAKKALGVLRSFIGGIKVEVNDVTFGLDIEPMNGAADSGDIEVDLPNLIVSVGEAARERGSAIGLFIDELQYFKQRELGALIMAMHKVQQQRLPVVLLGAGLPILPALAGESKSYAERLFAFPHIGALSAADSRKALQDPAIAAGARFDEDALTAIVTLTNGYPYFIQEWGYQSWKHAPTPLITAEIVRAATTRVTERLDANFFRVRFDRLTPSEKRFMRAMADPGPEPQRIGKIAAILQVKVSSLGPVRARLIAKGMIYSPAHGDLAFTVPLFDQFMRRAMPTLDR